MKTPYILGAAALGLMLFGKKSSAATVGRIATPSRGVGGYGGFGVGANRPMPNSMLGNRSVYYTAGQGATPDIWTSLGGVLGGMTKAGTFAGIGDKVGQWLGGTSSMGPVEAANYVSSLNAASGSAGFGSIASSADILQSIGYVAPQVTAPVAAGAVAESAGVGAAADIASTAAADAAVADVGGGLIADLGLADVGLADIAGWALF